MNSNYLMQFVDLFQIYMQVYYEDLKCHELCNYDKYFVSGKQAKWA